MTDVEKQLRREIEERTRARKVVDTRMSEEPGIGPKIIEGLKQAIAGDWARVTIEGRAWIPETPLVRAAPDMLAALQFVYEHIADEHRDARDLYPAFGLDALRAVDQVRDAIAKATARPPRAGEG